MNVVISCWSRLCLLAFLVIPLGLLSNGCYKKEQPSDNQTALSVRRVVARDLDKIKAEGVLRLLTRNNETDYFLYRGHQMGFEYDMANKLAEFLEVRLDIVTVTNVQDLIPYLDRGIGDIIGSGFSVNKDREGQIEFSTPYRTISYVAVTPEGEKPVEQEEDLFKRTWSLPDLPSMRKIVDTLQLKHRQTLNVEWIQETSFLRDRLSLVAKQKTHGTFANRVQVETEIASGMNVIMGATVSTPKEVAWGLRPNAPELKKAVNDFLAKTLKTEWFAVIFNRYFRDRKRISRRRRHSTFTLESGRVSPFDEIFREMGERYDFDWRFIAAVAYRESKFKPKQESWAGAKGLMQIVPETGKRYGVDCFANNYNNILCGTRYLRKLFRMFPYSTPEDRVKLVLASYNAGIGHVRDAQHLCVDKRWNPNVWTGHVEQALLLLTKRQWYSQYRHGYVQGHVTVQYVKDIISTYRSYGELVPLLLPEPKSGDEVSEGISTAQPPIDEAAQPTPQLSETLQLDLKPQSYYEGLVGQSDDYGREEFSIFQLPPRIPVPNDGRKP